MLYWYSTVKLTIYNKKSLLLSVLVLCRSHIGPQSHFHPTRYFLHPDCSWRAGAFQVNTKDSGTYLRLQQVLLLNSVLFLFLFFFCMVSHTTNQSLLVGWNPAFWCWKLPTMLVWTKMLSVPLLCWLTWNYSVACVVSPPIQYDKHAS